MINASISFIADKFQIVEIVSSENSYDTSAVKEALDAVKTLDVDPTKGVVISHRGAIWLHSAIAHYFHHTVWVAHFDPRLNGAVVAQSHKKGIDAGDFISIR